jgi:hypothetical protein
MSAKQFLPSDNAIRVVPRVDPSLKEKVEKANTAAKRKKEKAMEVKTTVVDSDDGDLLDAVIKRSPQLAKTVRFIDGALYVRLDYCS